MKDPQKHQYDLSYITPAEGSRWLIMCLNESEHRYKDGRGRV